ncbi:MAG: hypothetical protein MJA83_12290 [Gammaproteobacteria bacterium]|nr:hypothetical protein [Gammaproteobacteria bacterium]
MLNTSFFARFKLCVFAASAALVLAACGGSGGGSDNDGGGTTPPPTGGTPGSTTTFLVDVDPPDFVDGGIASAKQDRNMVDALVGILISEAVAASMPPSFRVLIYDDAGNVVADLTSQAVVTENPDGTFEITVPGDPRVDCVIVADINGVVSLRAPTTQVEVDINAVTEYAFEQVLSLAKSSPDFDWDNFSLEEMQGYVDQLEAAVEAAGGVDAVNNQDELDDLLEATIGEIADQLVGVISTPQADASQLAGLAGEYTLLDIGAGVFGRFGSDQLAPEAFSEVAEVTASVAGSGSKMDFKFAAFDEFDAIAVIDSTGSAFVELIQEADVDDETVTATVDADATLVFAIDGETDVEGDFAVVSQPHSFTLMNSNDVFVGTGVAIESEFGVSNGAPDPNNAIGTAINFNMLAFIKKSENFAAAQLDGKTYGFVDRFAFADESSGVVNDVGLEFGAAYGTASFTSSSVAINTMESTLQILTGGGLEFLDINEPDADNYNFTASPSGVVTFDTSGLPPGEAEEIKLYMSPDLNMFVGFVRESVSTNPEGGGVDILLGVDLPANADQSTLAGKTFDLKAWFNVLENNLSSVYEFPSLTLSFDGAGQARLDGAQIGREYNVPGAADLNSSNLITETVLGAIDLDETDTEVPMQSNFTVQPDGEFAITILNYQGEDNIFINGYVQDGGEVIVGTIVISSETATAANPNALTDPFLDSGVFIGYLRD